MLVIECRPVYAPASICSACVWLTREGGCRVALMKDDGPPEFRECSSFPRADKIARDWMEGVAAARGWELVAFSVVKSTLRLGGLRDPASQGPSYVKEQDASQTLSPDVCRSAQLTVAQASLTVLQDHDQAVWFLRDSPEFQRSQDAVICIEPGVRADLPRRVLDYFLSGIPDGVQVPASLHLDGREVFPVRGRTFGRQPESPEIAAFEAAMQEITRPCAVVPVAAEAQLRKQIAELEADNAALSQKLENAKREVLRRMPVKIVVDLSTESGMGSKRSREE